MVVDCCSRVFAELRERQQLQPERSLCSRLGDRTADRRVGVGALAACLRDGGLESAVAAAGRCARRRCSRCRAPAAVAPRRRSKSPCSTSASAAYPSVSLLPAIIPSALFSSYAVRICLKPSSGFPRRTSTHPRNQRQADLPWTSANSSTSECISSASAATRSVPKRISQSASNHIVTSSAMGWASLRARAYASCRRSRVVLTEPTFASAKLSIASTVTCGSAMKPMKLCSDAALTDSIAGSARSRDSRAASGRPWCIHACPRAVHAASARNASTCLRGKSVGSIRADKRFGVLPAQVVQEPEPVQEQSSHAVGGNICQK